MLKDFLKTKIEIDSEIEKDRKIHISCKKVVYSSNWNTSIETNCNNY